MAGWAFARSAGLRRWVLGIYWVAIFLLTHWPEVDDFPRPRWLFADFDLVVHACLYAGWAAVWCWVLDGQGYTVRGRVAGWLLAGGVTYAVFDELTQAIVGRDPAISDVIADTVGLGLAILFVRWAARRWGMTPGARK